MPTWTLCGTQAISRWWGDTVVDKINLEGSRVVSVDAVIGGERATVGAERVVVCAGAYGSPAVLMRSGVGAGGELARLGIETVVDLPGVGRNLHDHPAFGLEYRSTALFNSLMDDFVAGGRAVFAEAEPGKGAGAVDVTRLSTFTLLQSHLSTGSRRGIGGSRLRWRTWRPSPGVV